MEQIDPNVIFTGLTGLIVGILAYMGNKNAKKARDHAAAVNDAVNNTHPNDPKLYDLAKSNEAKLRTTHRRLDDLKISNDLAHSDINQRIDTLGNAVQAHVEWEENERYPQLEQDVSQIKKVVKRWENDVG